jgi:hypothetical protein
MAAIGGRRAANAGVALATSIAVMSRATVTNMMKRLMRYLLSLTLHTGAFAHKVTKLWKRRYFREFFFHALR